MGGKGRAAVRLQRAVELPGVAGRRPTRRHRGRIHYEDAVARRRRDGAAGGRGRAGGGGRRHAPGLCPAQPEAARAMGPCQAIGVTVSHFYLSHVRTVDEEWVASFFHDLCRVVAERTGRSPEVVGVHGKPHSPDVSADLLARSTVLVVLHSPRYFSQSYCRAELSYFQRRLSMQRSRTGRSADAVIPVMWEPDPAHPLDAVAPQLPLRARSDAFSATDCTSATPAPASRTHRLLRRVLGLVPLSTTVSPEPVDGFGGVGKTQIAQEYVHSHHWEREEGNGASASRLWSPEPANSPHGAKFWGVGVNPR